MQPVQSTLSAEMPEGYYWFRKDYVRRDSLERTAGRPEIVFIGPPEMFRRKRVRMIRGLGWHGPLADLLGAELHLCVVSGPIEPPVGIAAISSQ